MNRGLLPHQYSTPEGAKPLSEHSTTEKICDKRANVLKACIEASKQILPIMTQNLLKVSGMQLLII